MPMYNVDDGLVRAKPVARERDRRPIVGMPNIEPTLFKSFLVVVRCPVAKFRLHNVQKSAANPAPFYVNGESVVIGVDVAVPV